MTNYNSRCGCSCDGGNARGGMGHVDLVYDLIDMYVSIMNCVTPLNILTFEQ
jgi:hypothetical protein